MLDPKCIYRKSIIAKCTRLACLLSFGSLFLFDGSPIKAQSNNFFIICKIFWMFTLIPISNYCKVFLKTILTALKP